MNAKYMKPQSRLPFMGICLDATPAVFKECLRSCKQTKPTDLNRYKLEIAEIFKSKKNTNNAQVESVVTTLSVRSSWDLYFQCRKFPAGSEVMMTAINIGDMTKIVEEHGLIPVPVDIDPYTMAPSLQQIKAATTEKTKACLFAYLFGITYDLSPFSEFLSGQGIEIIEDCAQSWRGLDTFRGSPHALITMFSFGTIKYNTAFFGSVNIIRESASTG